MGKTRDTGFLTDCVFTDSSNNVGIGAAASGSYKLQVTGTSNFTSTINGAGVSLSDTLNGTTANFTSSVTGNFFIASPVATAAQSGGLRLNSQVAINARNAANSADITLITTNSSDGVAIRNGALTIASTGAATFSSTVSISTASTSYGSAFYLINTSNSKQWNFTTVGSGISGRSGNLEINNNAADIFAITQAGNVGIGTTTPSTPLYVVGAMKCETGLYFNNTGANGAFVWQEANTPLRFATNDTERMRINSNGYLKLKTVSSTYSNSTHRIDDYQSAQGNTILVSGNASQADSIVIYSVSANSSSAAATTIAVAQNSSTGRSINAGGTINASGADYAEYMLKAIDETINKGDIVGVNENGELTNIFADAKSFVVKSTNPSYVGGDTWGSVDEIGKMPENPTDEEKAEYEAKLEAARAKVDRIAFSGQVPCNVYNAQVGDYIIPIELDGKTSGQAVSNPTFEQYQISVGKVWKIMEDGRAWIAVKIG
jgi:hypothetical protein